MTYNTAKEMKAGVMDKLDMLEHFIKGKNLEKGDSHGRMAAFMKETLLMVNSKASVWL